MTSLNFGIICAAASLLFVLASNLLANRKCNAKAPFRGCGSVPFVPRNDPLGLTRFRQMLKARREKRALPWMVEVMDSAGQDVHTAQDKIFGHSLIWTRDLENSRAILASQANDFDIGTARRERQLPVIGSGIFNRTGDAWRESRNFLKPHFARDQVSSLGLQEEHFQAMLNLIEIREGEWTPSFDIQPLIFNFALDVATKFLFGKSANSQVAATGERSAHADFQYHWDSAATFSGIRTFLGPFRWMYSSREFQKHCNAIHAYADGYVQAAIERKKKRNPDGVTDKKANFVLLDALVDVTCDCNRLRDECLNVLGAARTSTAALIQWVFFFLARHPRTFDKLRMVILAEFGNFENRDKVTFEGLKRCRFLHHCINETLRISPVIPVHIRVAVRDTTLPKGGGPHGKDPIFVPKGMEVRQAFYPMCMRTDIWGEDAARFKPERFEDRKLLSEWIPFGAGPRTCLGQSLALTETSYLIVRFLQKFDKIESTDSPGPIRYEWNISSRSANGVNVKLHKASL